MKKITIFLTIVLVALVAGEAYYFMGALNRAPVAVAQVTPKAPKVLQIVLYRESGDISYKRPSDTDYQSLTTASVEIPNLTSVKTSVGRGSVLLPDNSLISLSDNTEISVNYTEQATSIFQSIGTTYHRVEALVTGKTYEVQTPGTLAAVRGTKFAVSYDKVKSITKVAVTEHKVSVSRVQKSFEPNATTTEIKLEEIIVNEGDSAKVSEAPVVATNTPKGTKPAPVDNSPRLVVSKIDTDVELKTWVEENKTKDPIIDKLKTENKDKVEYRKRVEDLLKSEADVTPDATKPEDSIKPNDKTKSTDETKPVSKTDVKAPATTGVKPPLTTTAVRPIASTTPIIVKKISEEVFFDNFNNLFVKYFYIENDDGVCSITLSSSGRVKEISDYATASGYPLPAGSAESLIKFADSINSYCKNAKGDVKARTVLQTRFDDEFPFKQSI